MLISVTQLVHETLRLYWTNLRYVLRYLLVILLVWGVLAVNGILGISYAVEAFNGSTGSILVALVQFAIIALFFMVSIAFNRTLSALIRNQVSPTMWAQLKAAKKVFLPSALVTVMLGLIVFAGTLLFVIPGIVFTLWYYFSVYAAMIDGYKPMAALKASKTLVNGRFGQVLWRLAAPAAIYILIFSMGIWSIVTPGQYFLAATGNFPVYWLAIGLAIIFYFLLFPIITITPLLLYEHLRTTPIKSEE